VVRSFAAAQVGRPAEMSKGFLEGVCARGEAGSATELDMLLSSSLYRPSTTVHTYQPMLPALALLGDRDSWGALDETPPHISESHRGGRLLSLLSLLSSSSQQDESPSPRSTSLAHFHPRQAPQPSSSVSRANPFAGFHALPIQGVHGNVLFEL